MNFLKRLRGFKLNLVDNRVLLGVVCVFYYLLQASPAYAWGPAVHYQLGLKFIELGIGGAILGEVIRENKKHFLYGNVIADIIAGKSKIDFPDSSHNWEITAELNRNATTTAQKVFSLGFQLHLAADTVAHNDFI
ncbi:MAG: zinc dependent phospholipase C family protein, partial [bacterium]